MVKSENKNEKNSSAGIISVSENEKNAAALIKTGDLTGAEKLLLENLEAETGSSPTYDMLLNIYGKENNYHKIIKVLNTAVKYSDDRQKYRKIKKDLVTRKIMDDISLAEDAEEYQ